MAGRALTLKSVIAVLLLMSGPADAQVASETPPEAPTVVFTLPQAVEHALNHNPALAAADADIDVYEAKLLQAVTAYVPRFKLKSLLTAMPAARGDAFSGYIDTDEWGPFLRIQIDAGMPVYTFGKLEALRRLANAGVDVSRGKRRVAVEEITFQAARAFYGWQYARELRDIIEDGKSYLEKAKRRLEEMEARDDPEYDQIDMLKAKVYEGDIRSRELDLDKGAFMAHEGMRVILGLPGDAQFEIADEPLEPVAIEILPVERYAAIADRMRPELEAARAAVMAAEHNADLKFAGFWPSLGIVGSYTFSYSGVADDQQSPFSIDPYNSNGGGAALGLEWELDIAQKIGEYNEARAGWVKGRNEVEFARQKLLLEVKETWQDLHRHAELIDVQSKAMRAARGWLIAKSDLYDAGFATMQDVVDSLLEYYKRKMGHIEAIYNFNLAVAQLSRQVGVDVTTLAQEELVTQPAPAAPPVVEPAPAPAAPPVVEPAPAPAAPAPAE